MSPKCVHGEHEMQARCLTMYWSEEKVPCEPEPTPPSPPDPDLASLMSTEPAVERRSNSPGILDSQTRDQLRRQQAEQTQASMAARIQALEGVLVTIRGRASIAVHAADRAALSIAEGHAQPLPERCGTCYSTCQGLVDLINSTLSPHQPWCRDESHEGACQSDPEERDDGE